VAEAGAVQQLHLSNSHTPTPRPCSSLLMCVHGSYVQPSRPLPSAAK
jgi:hypothetical protein